MSDPGDFSGKSLNMVLLPLQDILRHKQGCFILKPALFFIWEEIQEYFNKAIKGMGVKNCSLLRDINTDQSGTINLLLRSFLGLWLADTLLSLLRPSDPA
jgi:hypothetical protein